MFECEIVAGFAIPWKPGYFSFEPRLRSGKGTYRRCPAQVIGPDGTVIDVECVGEAHVNRTYFARLARSSWSYLVRSPYLHSDDEGRVQIAPGTRLVQNDETS